MIVLDTTSVLRQFFPAFFPCRCKVSGNLLLFWGLHSSSATKNCWRLRSGLLYLLTRRFSVETSNCGPTTFEYSSEVSCGCYSSIAEVLDGPDTNSENLGTWNSGPGYAVTLDDILMGFWESTLVKNLGAESSFLDRRLSGGSSTTWHWISMSFPLLLDLMSSFW